jgi:uncharacterized protein
MSFARRCVVFDTSTLIGVLLFPRSEHASAFRRILGEHQAVASADTLKELSEVALRPEFDRYRTLAERAAFIKLYADMVEIVPVIETVSDCRDAKDNKFLSLALTAKAGAIISSDDDLLVLNPYRGIAVGEMAAFVDLDSGRD